VDLTPLRLLTEDAYKEGDLLEKGRQRRWSAGQAILAVLMAAVVAVVVAFLSHVLKQKGP